MNTSSLQTANVEQLVSELVSPNPVARQSARKSLVELGTSDVTEALVKELIDPREQVRWESAKALATLADPVSAPALVNALEDDNDGVRWLAAEGLVSIGKPGLLVVLSSLLKRSGSTTFCQSAHHVVHSCSTPEYAKTLAPVLAALTGPEPGACVPPAAYRALMALKVGKPIGH